MGDPLPDPEGPGTKDVKASMEQSGSSGRQKRIRASGGPEESRSMEGTHTPGNGPNCGEAHPSPELEDRGKEKNRESKGD